MNKDLFNSDFEFTVNSQNELIIDGDLKPLVPFNEIPFKVRLVTGDVIIENVTMEDLTNAPEIVKGSFTAKGCKLKRLDGAPKVINGDEIDISNNELIEINKLPQFFSGSVNCSNNFICSIPNNIFSKLDYKNNLVSYDIRRVQAGNPGVSNNLTIYGTYSNAFNEFYRDLNSYYRINKFYSDSEILEIRERIYNYTTDSNKKYDYDHFTLNYLYENKEFLKRERNMEYPVYLK